ncbi:MAG TPA: phosphoenolpyruvate carboxykinase (ATP) [Burkholderiaceae bacterium]|nr:phosphoenolpyruvate carboxykinase (ATP) [Burkholderiaceae bacterium]
MANLDLSYLGLGPATQVHYQRGVAELVEAAVRRGEGTLTASGALAADTGRFTGRSPRDRFIVKDRVASGRVDWGDTNQPIGEEDFQRLYGQVIDYLDGRELYATDVSARTGTDRTLSLRVLTESPYQSVFCHNMFLPNGQHSASQAPEWSVLVASGLQCNDPQACGIHSPNFVVISFEQQVVLIAGTGYTGEIKKSIFSVLNFILPVEQSILPMHCAANTDGEGNTALFFGLSGTGKTTLSADIGRQLIGDDEHGWDDNGIFNFEGGCYAKCAGLSEQGEPQIFQAIRFGALLENTNYFPGTRVPDYDDVSKTENTRVAYPIHHIQGAVASGTGGPPRNIFFLTADAFGVLPPISLLNRAQAMYHFMSGYTAKVAGTEVGVTEPQAIFSACFGQAFLPLHPFEYATLLGRKIGQGNIRVWLVNTGWIAGPYGIGRRIKLDYTRAMVRAAMDGSLLESAMAVHPVFGLEYPTACPGVPDGILDPTRTWHDRDAYYAKANQLAGLFADNFKKFGDGVPRAVTAAAPQPMTDGALVR